MLRRTQFLRKADPNSHASAPVKRKKNCRECKTSFTATRPLQCVCSPGCAIKWGFKVNAKEVEKAAKAEKRADKAKRESLKTRSDYMKEAQREFNKYVRARDRAAGRPCVSSGRPLDWSGNGVDAGHYRSTGAAPHLRFHLDNCHAQSKHDNQYLSGNAVDYRLRLIERIGLERVEALEADNTPRHYSIDDLKAIKTKYRALAKAIERDER